MTTGRGMPVDPAPRIAYQLAAAAAAGDDAAVAALWDPLDDSGRARVLGALGSQARSTAHATGDPAGTTTELLVGQALDVLADLHDCRLRQAALSALAGRPPGPLPACDGCPQPAVALAWARLRVLQAIGFDGPALAEMSRRAAYR